MLPLYSSILKQIPNTNKSQSFNILTEYKPTIKKIKENNGIIHPGIGLTKELLENIQIQIRNEAEPWKTYFKDMIKSSQASKVIGISLTNPSKTYFNSQNTNRYFIKDALTAYTQAILYYITGDNVYRKNVLQILRIWSKLDVEKYSYFTDACIHVGIPMNRMCTAAEIIRYSTYQITQGYIDSDLRWTDQEIICFIEHLIDPAIKTFLFSCNEFMNQHLYTVIGAMSGYLFMDDIDGYAKTVEWFTINKNAKNQGFNGSIKRLFREIKTLDEIGQKEGSGKRLAKPVIQHVEMGRDQAHACGDLTNAVIISRLMLAQKTKVDPIEGTISDKNNAVSIYEFLDDRILKAADFFFQYMLGYTTNWVQVPFSIQNERIIDNYIDFSPNYRGRYNTINCWDLYVYYTNNRCDINLKEQYPYFYEGFIKKVPSNYFTKGKLQINWDNVDGGGDFWIFIPKDMINDTKLLAELQVDYRVEVEDRGIIIENKENILIKKENNIKFIRFIKSDKKSKIAITTGGTDKQTIAFYIRTDGMAKLYLKNGVEGSIYVPNTNGKWEYITFTRKDFEFFGDLYYIILSDIKGSYVDIDAIDIKPDIGNKSRKRIDILKFENNDKDASYVTYLKIPINIKFSAQNSINNHTIVYEGIELPDGAIIDKMNGLLEWIPDRIGDYFFYITARSAKTCIVKRIKIEVVKNRIDAIQSVIRIYNKKMVYTNVSYNIFKEEFKKAKKMINTTSDKKFMSQLKVLEKTVKNLKLVSPRLKNDSFTDGTSLDYTQIVYQSSMGKEIYNLIDGEGTFCGYYTAINKAHIMDFGSSFRISVTKFGFQSRYGFSDRLAGVQVFGSNDQKIWVQLTVKEAAYTQLYQEIEVKSEEKNNRYRYLKICKTTEYPEALRGDINYLLEFSELRIFGNCYEIEFRG